MQPAAVRSLLAAAVLGAVPAWAGISYLAACVATAAAHRRIPPMAGASVIHFTALDGMRLAAWRFDPPAGTRRRATVVLAHGYRDDRRQLTALASPLTALGMSVVALDFRGHGESGGDRITLGVHEAEDVRAALDAVASPGVPVGYVGFSMGAAAYLLSGREADAAVLDSPYDTLPEAVGARMDVFLVPRFLGSELVRHGGQRANVIPETVRPIDRVSTLRRPTLFVFGRHDRWLTAATRARFRERLPHATASELVLEGGHADHFSDAWSQQVVSFLDGALPAVTTVRSSTLP